MRRQFPRGFPADSPSRNSSDEEGPVNECGDGKGRCRRWECETVGNQACRIECRFRRFRATSPPVPALRGRGGAILAAMPADAQPPAPDGPLIVQSDKSVLLEVARPSGRL